MEWLQQGVDFFLHFDKHLDEIIQSYGTWTYLILFLIVFAETGLVVTPFLPGDSLLFAAGALAGRGSLDIVMVCLLLVAAAITGDNVNYWIGKCFGNLVLHHTRGRFIRKEHLDKTHQYFERYGGKTIVIARFVPIVRTFAPFVAGLGAMKYPRFVCYSLGADILWVSVCVGAGYLFGGLAFVREHFSIVVLGIVFVSLLPAVFEYLRHRAQNTPRSGGDDGAKPSP